MSLQLMMAPPPSQQSQGQLLRQSELTEAQSLALVKIFLNSSLACICHTRELIDWQSDCFGKRFIDHIDLNNDDAYHNFRDRTPAAPGSSQEVRVLVHSANHQANSVLEMIEHGVFEAIERAYLDTLQVFITTDSADAKAIRETYTYSFHYYRDAVASVELKEQQQYLSLSDAKRSLKAAVRCLLRAVKDLPRLPAKRSLGMSIAYNDKCPKTYEPDGFVAATNHKILDQDWDKLWNYDGHPVSKFDSSHHTVNITARNSTFGYQTASQIQDTVISKQLQDLQKTSSAGHPGLVSTLPAPVSPRARSALPTRGSSRNVARSSPSTTRVTKSRKAKVKTTTRSRSQSSNATNLKVTHLGKNPLSGLAILAKSRRRRDIVPAKLAEVIVHAHCLDFDARDGGTHFDPDLLANGALCRKDPADTIRCECGDQRPGESLAFCNLCNTWQHCQCYGLELINRQKSRPNEHLCYSCLLLPKEEHVLAGMIDLVRMRLALIYISGLPDAMLDINELSARVFGSPKADGAQFADLIKRLVDDKIITQPSNGAARVLSLAPEEIRKLQTECLDPLAAVSHLYRTARDADTESSVAAELKAELKRYAVGHDYTAGQGVDDIVVTDSFGEPLVRWGYYTKVMKHQATIEVDGIATPRRRKISVSKAFINLDRSTPASSLSFDEDEPFRSEHGAVSPNCELRVASC